MYLRLLGGSLKNNIILYCLRFFQVSLVGFLFLLGLYISSLASCMGGLYGAPRILQCIAQENVIPMLACLGRGVSCPFSEIAVKPSPEGEPVI